jgi:hypothetical protein
MKTTAPEQRPPRPTLQIVESESSTIDVRLWARLYVATLLEIEGVSVTPTAIADAS